MSSERLWRLLTGNAQIIERLGKCMAEDEMKNPIKDNPFSCFPHCQYDGEQFVFQFA